MLAATEHARDELLGEMAPNYGRPTFEKVAMNAVLTGRVPASRSARASLFLDENHGKGTNVRFGTSSARPEPVTMIPKFPSPEDIHVSWPAPPRAASPWRFAAGSEHTTGSRSVTRAD